MNNSIHNSDADEETKKRFAKYDKLLADAQAILDGIEDKLDERKSAKIVVAATGLANFVQR